jgi:hypothetical protein
VPGACPLTCAARARAQGHQLQARSKGAHKNVAMALLAMRGEMQAEVADADDQQRKMSNQRKEEVLEYCVREIIGENSAT